MSNTKQKILEAALSLFNQKGVSSTSLRNIADEAGISVGNLQYHFKKREDILEALYFQLVQEMDRVVFPQMDDLLTSVFDISAKMIAILYEYHFFLLDFTAIIRKNEKIKAHYRELSKRRENEFLQIIDVLIQKGLMRQEMLKNEYRNLFKRIEVLSNFWFSSVLIEQDVLAKKWAIEQYSLLVRQSIYPYLTAAAQVQYTTIFPSRDE